MDVNMNEIIDFGKFRLLSNKEQGEIVAKLISNAVNNGGRDTFLKTMNEAIRRDHRALQADIYAGIIRLIGDVAKDYDNERYDGRNAVYVRFFKAIVENLMTDGGRYINSDKLPVDTVGY